MASSASSAMLALALCCLCPGSAAVASSTDYCVADGSGFRNSTLLIDLVVPGGAAPCPCSLCSCIGATAGVGGAAASADSAGSSRGAGARCSLLPKQHTPLAPGINRVPVSGVLGAAAPDSRRGSNGPEPAGQVLLLRLGASCACPSRTPPDSAAGAGTKAPPGQAEAPGGALPAGGACSGGGWGGVDIWVTQGGGDGGGDGSGSAGCPPDAVPLEPFEWVGPAGDVDANAGAAADAGADPTADATASETCAADGTVGGRVPAGSKVYPIQLTMGPASPGASGAASTTRATGTGGGGGSAGESLPAFVISVAGGVARWVPGGAAHAAAARGQQGHQGPAAGTKEAPRALWLWRVLYSVAVAGGCAAVLRRLPRP